MPLYPYRCTQCGHRFEKIQSFSSEPEKTCPKCGGALERLLTAPGLQFKGAGWYVNDYAAKSGSSASGSGESKAPAESKSSPESKPSSTSTETSSTAAAPSSNSSASTSQSSTSKD